MNKIKSKFTELAKKLARGNAPKGEATHDQAMRATTLLIALIHESGAPAAEKRWLLAEILRLHFARPIEEATSIRVEERRSRLARAGDGVRWNARASSLDGRPRRAEEL